MNRSKQRVAIFGALAVLLAGFSAATSAPSASGQGGGGEITAIELSGPGRAGRRLGRPCADARPPRPGSCDTPVTPSDAQPAEAGGDAESVIGPDGRTRVTNTTGYPAYADRPDRVRVRTAAQFICTGWLIDSNSILTAGHCAYDRLPRAGRSSSRPRGTRAATATRTPAQSAAARCPPSGPPRPSGSATQQPYFDFSVMNFAPSPASCAEHRGHHGTFGLYANATLDALNNVRAIVQGYPGTGPSAPTGAWADGSTTPTSGSPSTPWTPPAVSPVRRSGGTAPRGRAPGPAGTPSTRTASGSAASPSTVAPGSPPSVSARSPTIAGQTTAPERLRRGVLVVAALAAVVALSGCGGDDGGAADVSTDAGVTSATRPR